MMTLSGHQSRPSCGLALFNGKMSDFTRNTIHCNENPIYVFLCWELRGLSPNFHIHVSVSDFIQSQDRSTYFPAAEYRQIDPGNIEISHRTEHFNSVLEISVSFLEIVHKREPDIYIGLSPVKHLGAAPGAASDDLFVKEISENGESDKIFARV